MRAWCRPTWTSTGFIFRFDSGDLAAGRAADSVCSLSHWERVGVRGGVRGSGLPIDFEPPHPTPLSKGEREPTEIAATQSIQTTPAPSRSDKACAPRRGG